MLWSCAFWPLDSQWHFSDAAEQGSFPFEHHYRQYKLVHEQPQKYYSKLDIAIIVQPSNQLIIGGKVAYK